MIAARAGPGPTSDPEMEIGKYDMGGGGITRRSSRNTQFADDIESCYS